MNYYGHHIGDYAAATAHLTWAQDMAYTRLIRLYYQTEKPIPSDLSRACILVRATSKAERQAVEDVLHEFFTLQDDGWHQKRCDEELKHMQAKSEKARSSVSIRWGKKTDNERNTNVLPTQCEGNTPNNQEPITNNQEPIKKQKRAIAPGVDRPEWLPAEWEEFERHRMEKKARLTPTARKRCIENLSRWREQGHDISEILAKSISNGWTGLFEPSGKASANQSVADAWARDVIDGTAERVNDVSH